MKRGARIGIAVIAGLVLFVGGGIGLWKTTASSTPPAASGSVQQRQAAPLSASPLIGSVSLSQAIASLQGRLRHVPNDWRSYANLGLAYVQQARVTADPSYYPKAQGVLRKSLELNRSENDVAAIGMGALAAARHDFAGALAWGRRAERINPYSDNVYGVIGDAQTELGEYPQAFATIQHMVDLKPQLSSYSRISYQLELRGQTALATSSMRDALSAAGTPEDAAWSSNQLGDLYWNSGRLTAAAREYRAAVGYDPTFVPPLAGLANVAWARGDTTGAIRRYRAVVARYPLPQYVISLGDLYAAAGQPDQAAREYALVRTEEALFRANGVNVDLELALFDTDHGDVRAGLSAARSEWHRRHSVLVADALAWALYRSGDARAALTYEHKALSLGMRGALFFFHAGMIERALGNDAAARGDLRTALRINPFFSIQHVADARVASRAMRGAT
jgi:tetratricopeptide (TPR) repeat protein